MSYWIGISANKCFRRYGKHWNHGRDNRSGERDNRQMTKCRFCDDEAVAVFDMPRGCVCYPEDRQQSLCMQHIVKANTIGGMELKHDLTVGGEFTNYWLGR
jgi:hypothetical protein